MNNTGFQEALTFAQQVSNPHSPYGLCRVLGIEIISDKPVHKDGYLVFRDGCKLIFVNSLIHCLAFTVVQALHAKKHEVCKLFFDSSPEYQKTPRDFLPRCFSCHHLLVSTGIFPRLLTFKSSAAATSRIFT